MYFRLRCRLEGLRIDTDEQDLAFVVGSPPVRVELTPATAADTGPEANTTHHTAVASAERNPNERIVAAFTALGEGRVPDGSRDVRDPAWSGYLEEDGSLRRATRLPLPTELLPESMQSFVNQVREQLHGAVRQVVDVIRWRMAVPGPPDPVTSGWRSAEWSLDGESWYALPASFVLVIRGTPRVVVDEEIRASLAHLLESAAAEPTGHVLFREAWALRETHLRSALLTGIAALEVGFKDFAAELVPDAEWLLVNVPSPPVVKMLKGFLPTLNTRARIRDQVVPPPKAILDVLEKGVTLRNQVAHANAQPLKSETIESVLLAVRDVLWLMDFYRGHTWAWEHLRDSTRAQLAPGESA